MAPNLVSLLGLLADGAPAYVAAEDLLGPHGTILRQWQRRGFLALVPEPQPVPSCPHCFFGEPYQAGGRWLRGRCRSRVPEAHRQRWRFDFEAFLRWLGRRWQLDGPVQAIDGRTWHLGSLWNCGFRVDCFYASQGVLSEAGRMRLRAYRQTVLLRALPAPESGQGFGGPCGTLLDLFQLEGATLRVRDVRKVLCEHATVRFEAANGSLWAGHVCLGNIPVGSKEHAFLACLAESVDQYVSYADLKHAVQRATGSRDTADEATLCHKLKSRIKQRIPQVDRLLVTTNKGDGYRLREWDNSRDG